jgi:type VI secretion system protein ImpC
MEFKLDLASSRPAGDAEARRGDSRRLLVLGDFSGAPAAERKPLADRPTLRVDIDTLDTVMARLAPRVELPGGTARFTQLDDFHPDALHAQLPLFQALREARARPPASGGDLLGSLLGGTAAPAPTSGAAPAAAGIDAFVRSLVAPHIVPDTRAQDTAYRNAVDAATAEQMRAVLHAPAFQALESAWRGVQWLLQQLELDESLQLHLFDVTRDELLADVVASQGQLAQTGLHRALADRWRNVPGGEPWHLLTGLYAFGNGDTDIGLLAALGLVAQQAGGAFVAQAGADLVDAPGAGWQALRASEAAPWIGLAAPRLLLRLPYGAKTDPVSAFAFEELPAGTPPHEQLLWGNAALAVTLLAGRGGGSHQIDDLPAYTFTVDGERVLLPCAERQLGEQAGHGMIAAGLMPLASHRHRNAVTVMRLQSVADPAQPLANIA